MRKSCRDITALKFINGFGAKKIMALAKAVSDTEQVFNMPFDEIRRLTGSPVKNIDDLRCVRQKEEYLRELKYINEEDIRTVSFFDDDYPEALRHLYAPPPVLFYKGEFEKEDKNAVAVIGSRKCSLYGMRMAEKIAYDLAVRGITVISGMALGIDSAAHRGALKAGGRTIAIMGSGFKHIYPASSTGLAEKISKSGAVVTEYLSDMFPLKGNFPMRNRIISGMSKAVVVVEAARKSGAMITANIALEQGKEVLAFPGRADLNAAQGTNFLIQQGAKLILGVEDILEEINIETKDVCAGAEHESLSVSGQGAHLNDKEKGLVEVLKKNQILHIDELLDFSSSGISSLSETLINLQIKGLIKESAGRNYSLVNSNQSR
ncbi:MAG: DNA-processing protein DprA [Candidatus Omnitrophota bacterium]